MTHQFSQLDKKFNQLIKEKPNEALETQRLRERLNVLNNKIVVPGQIPRDPKKNDNASIAINAAAHLHDRSQENRLESNLVKYRREEEERQRRSSVSSPPQISRPSYKVPSSFKESDIDFENLGGGRRRRRRSTRRKRHSKRKTHRRRK
jgi:hypothetical protein